MWLPGGSGTAVRQRHGGEPDPALQPGTNWLQMALGGRKQVTDRRLPGTHGRKRRVVQQAGRRWVFYRLRVDLPTVRRASRFARCKWGNVFPPVRDDGPHVAAYLGPAIGLTAERLRSFRGDPFGYILRCRYARASAAALTGALRRPSECALLSDRRGRVQRLRAPPRSGLPPRLIRCVTHGRGLPDDRRNCGVGSVPRRSIWRRGTIVPAQPLFGEMMIGRAGLQRFLAGRLPVMACQEHGRPRRQPPVPMASAPADELFETDFAPFRALSDCRWG
jgi:hypothetical protein